ncbi:MAG: DIP1984 family protein [Cyanobacteriota bacterium]|nr:DIP1984 family protein [Cyanobacteriota bacterium]
MKLAEALILRADCQKRIEQLGSRLTRSAKVQEGEEPPENPQALLGELEGAINELADLIKRINKTNSQVTLEESQTISDALAERDVIKKKLNIYEQLIYEAASQQNRYSSSEIKYISTVNVRELQRQKDLISRQYRELDTKIQAANWNIELVS